MWLPVALLNLGKGEAKGTGAVTGFVGVVVVLGAFIQAAVFKDNFTAGLLFAHGILYCSVSYALLTGRGYALYRQCQFNSGNNFCNLHGPVLYRGK